MKLKDLLKVTNEKIAVFNYKEEMIWNNQMSGFNKYLLVQIEDKEVLQIKSANHGVLQVKILI